MASKVEQLDPQLLLRLSIVVAVVTIALKTLAWWITHSVGLLSDAMESLVNLASAAFALLMVTIARRPADKDHPYGHHKAEYFSSGFEGLAIFVAAGGIIWTAIERLLNPQPLDALGWGLALSVLSSAINFVLAWAMMQAGRHHRSIALEGDARHLMTDVWTSAGVVVGVGLVAFTKWQWLDPLVAIGVALKILREGGALMW
jgi:cation diffusion facilitator family transporter